MISSTTTSQYIDKREDKKRNDEMKLGLKEMGKNQKTLLFIRIIKRAPFFHLSSKQCHILPQPIFISENTLVFGAIIQATRW